jgi:murein DD-endopeptidase MepM/ murein hydrolase activator NlpD
VSRAGIALLLLLAALAIAAAPAARASKVYRWVDRHGVVHYGDRAPDASAVSGGSTGGRVIPVRAEPGAMVALRLQRDGGDYLAWADNRLAGPVQVRLSFTRQSNVLGAPALPARATVDPLGSALVARIGAADASRPGDFELRLEAVPGTPNARPRDFEYAYPLRGGNLQVAQGFGGAWSHHDEQNHYAVDFVAPIGTPVLAARDGTVMQVESDFDKAGLNLEKYGGRANFVRILHDDGTMALYAHLREGGVLVRVGQRVARAQEIGLSGNTGFTSGPHLHFAVQANRDMRLVSIPFRMFGPQGILRFTDTSAR